MYLVLLQKHRMQYSQLKKKIDTDIRLQIKMQKVPKISAPVAIIIQWYEPNKKRDPDNVFSGVKFILDAMQDRYTYQTIGKKRQKFVTSTGIWKDDNYQHFPGGLLHTLEIDPSNPRIEVYILPQFTLNKISKGILKGQINGGYTQDTSSD
jgi:hypothetical protein